MSRRSDLGAAWFDVAKFCTGGCEMHNESQWRYRAKRMGLRLVRYSQSLGYREYGPYGLVDQATGRIVGVRLGPEEVERMLFGEIPDDAAGAGRLPTAEPAGRSVRSRG